MELEPLDSFHFEGMRSLLSPLTRPRVQQSRAVGWLLALQ